MTTPHKLCGGAEGCAGLSLLCNAGSSLPYFPTNMQLADMKIGRRPRHKCSKRHPCVYANVRHNVCSTPDRSRCRTFLRRVRNYCCSVLLMPKAFVLFHPVVADARLLRRDPDSEKCQTFQQAIFCVCGRHRLISRPT